MDEKEIKETDTWTLYEEALSYCRMIRMFEDTDRNYRMYNGDQWNGRTFAGMEPVVLNFIKPIVKYKTGNILLNYFAIKYSSENYENQEFIKPARKISDLLSKKASRIWEKDYMDIKARRIAKDACINDEGVVFVRTDENNLPVNEVLNKNDVFYGDENEMEIENQPYILIKQRKPVSEVKAIAEANGVSEKELDHIIGDLQNLEQAGEAAKYEKDNKCTIVTKLYKKDGNVYFSQTTRYVELKKETNTGLKYYPVAHMIWEEKKGSARGEGEVRGLIPNQLEANKTETRRAITVKNTAYNQRIANIAKIQNPEALDEVGGTIKVTGGATTDDVAKIFANIPPAQMSPDAKELLNELIQSTRELAGAGDIATGQVDPSSASGRAILATQEAAQQPLTENLANLKKFIEDLARIWLDMIIVYSEDGIDLEEEVEDPYTKEKTIQLVHIPKVSLEELQAVVTIDITRKSAFDKYAQEEAIDALLKAGMFSAEKMPELERYVKVLDDDSSKPKIRLQELVDDWNEEQQRIAQIEAQAQELIERTRMFIDSDPEAQVGQIMDAQAQTAMAQ